MWKCIISEHIWRADQNVEVYEYQSISHTATIWAYLKDGEYILFNSLADFIAYLVDGESIGRKYCSEDELDSVLESGTNWYNIEPQIVR
jgi:hypothetical protein